VSGTPTGRRRRVGAWVLWILAAGGAGLLLAPALVASGEPAVGTVAAVAPVLLVLLSWMFRITRDLRDCLGRREPIPLLEVALTVFFPPFVLWWSFRMSRLLRQAQELAGLRDDPRAVLTIALSLFGLFPVALAIFQDDLNRLWDRVDVVAGGGSAPPPSGVPG
jgi:hypothetical protein